MVRPRWSRVHVLRLLLVACFGLLAGRLLYVQVISHRAYAVLADDQQRVVQKLFPSRGRILTREPDGTLYPLAMNADEALLFADPRRVEDPVAAAQALSPILSLTPEEAAALATSLGNRNRSYLAIRHRLTFEQEAAVQTLDIAGLHLVPEPWRRYTEGSTTGNLLGFVGFAADGELKVGRYGIEQSWEEALAGSGGYISGLRSGTGGLIAGATEVFQPAHDGSDLVLTINRALQFEACRALQESVDRWEAAGGAVVVMDPKTGAILAMCSSPTFDPNSYGNVESAAQYENHALLPYEPGSVVKPITMSSAIDVGAVTPNTTFTDPGQEEIGGFKIKNAQEKKWGLQTMTGVLEHSINTGMVFAMRKMGPPALARYFDSFNLGKPTEVGLAGDRSGDISSLDKRGEIYPATASFGQGITATPLQLAVAYSAMANGGSLMKPYVVAEVVQPDGQRTTTQPTVVRQVIKPSTASSIKAMLASVVNSAPIHNALIPGFWVAGKTGTAQIYDPNGGYYADRTNHTFAGFAPVSDPAVVTIAKLEMPKVAWAEGSAGPLFQKVTAAALRILRIQPDNP